MARALNNWLWCSYFFVGTACAATVMAAHDDDSKTNSLIDLSIKYAWVVLISLVSWAASSLPVLADWEEGNSRKRLFILQCVLKALFFGTTAFLGSVGAGQNIMLSYLAAAAAAYAGDRYFSFGKKDPEDSGSQSSAEGAK